VAWGPLFQPQAFLAGNGCDNRNGRGNRHFCVQRHRNRYLSATTLTLAITPAQFSVERGPNDNNSRLGRLFAMRFRRLSPVRTKVRSWPPVMLNQNALGTAQADFSSSSGFADGLSAAWMARSRPRPLPVLIIACPCSSHHSANVESRG